MACTAQPGPFGPPLHYCSWVLIVNKKNMYAILPHGFLLLTALNLNEFQSFPSKLLIISSLNGKGAKAFKGRVGSTLYSLFSKKSL